MKKFGKAGEIFKIIYLFSITFSSFHKWFSSTAREKKKKENRRGKNRNKALGNKKRNWGWRQAREIEKKRSKINQVQIQIPHSECDHYVCMSIKFLKITLVDVVGRILWGILDIKFICTRKKFKHKKMFSVS